MASINQQSQILAKTITFVLVVSVAFILGRGGFTGSTVGDFGSTNKYIGFTILALACVGGAVLWNNYRKTMRN